MLCFTESEVKYLASAIKEIVNTQEMQDKLKNNDDEFYTDLARELFLQFEICEIGMQKKIVSFKSDDLLCINGGNGWQ